MSVRSQPDWRRRLERYSAWLMLALALALWWTTPAQSQVRESGRTPVPAVAKAASGTQCVVEPSVMRRTHMDLLKHQRDRTVRVGDRSSAVSLKACVDCHASATTRSVAAAPTDFCQSCHSYSAVKIDCFECHSSHASPQAASLAKRP
ncbi:MAG: hypothetical protein J0M20_00635 [Burkholderiales bacterium]|nr:hypothetical protein [Burkholderiales bacterium]